MASTFSTVGSSAMDTTKRFQYHDVVDEICQMDWISLTSQDMISVAWAYYYFSVQFRENLKIACALYPYDRKLRDLEREECGTSNLSPFIRNGKALLGNWGIET
jgi:hypothetical protein